MADASSAPRRVSMAYILGFSNKPFKDGGPPAPPQPPSPRHPNAFKQMVTTPGGVIEWAASDGRRGRLTGPGKPRLTAANLTQVPSVRASAEAASKKEAAVEDIGSLLGIGLCADGPASPPKEEIKKDTDKDDELTGGDWTDEQDKKLMESKGGNKPWKKIAEEIGKKEHECRERFDKIKPEGWRPNGKGGGDGNQKQKEKKGQKTENQNQNQNQNPEEKKENEKKDEYANQGSTPDDSGGTNNNSNSWDTSGNNNGGNGTSWDTSGNNDNNNNNGWNLSGDNSGGNSWESSGNKNGWGTSGNNNGTGGNDSWNIGNSDGNNDSGGGGVSGGENTWGADNSASWDNKNNNNNMTTDDKNSKKGSFKGSSSSKNAKSSSDKPASQSCSKNVSSHKSERSSSGTPTEIELKPDSTFSADDLRLIAKILQQDCSMVWNRVSWRFKDKTGRNLHPNVLEKKITGKVEERDSDRGRR